MSTEEAPQNDPKKGNNILKIIIFIVSGFGLCSLGFGAGYFFFANPLSPNEDVLTLINKSREAPKEKVESTMNEKGFPQKAIKPVPEKELFVTSYYTFPEPVTTNLAESRRFLQLSVGVSTQYDEQVIQNVEIHQLALRSDILGVLASFTEAQANSREGREKLADDIRKAMNSRLKELEGFGGVENVFFPGFVLQ